jgi:hypothetical protein
MTQRKLKLYFIKIKLIPMLPGGACLPRRGVGTVSYKVKVKIIIECNYDSGGD